MRWNENDETKKKANSPNSIYFYLKKYNNDEEKAKVALGRYRDGMNGKLKRPNQVSFWIDKGYTKEDAKKMVSQSQSKRSKGKRIKSPFNSEVENYMKNLDLSYDEAYEKACLRRRRVSPRLVEYWIDRGYSKSEAEVKISEIQRSFSKRCIESWLEAGHSEEEATKLLAEEQDKRSIKALTKRLNCTPEEALSFSNESFDTDEVFTMMLLYFTYRVRQSTEKVYKFNKDKIDPEGLRGKDYHLDHRKSIRQCFIDGDSIEFASSVENIQILQRGDNLKKGSE